MRLKTLPLDLIEEPSHPIRSVVDVEALEALTASIEKVGVKYPLLVKKKGDGEKYEIIDGHMRYLACRQLEKTSVPVLIQEKAGDLSNVDMVITNVVRMDMNPIDLAHALLWLKDTLKISTSQLGAMMGRSHDWVSDRLQLLSFPEHIQKAVRENLLPIATAQALARIRDPETSVMYTDMAVKGKATTETVKEWVRNWEEEEDRKERARIDYSNGEKVAEIAIPKRTCTGCRSLFPIDQTVNIPVCPTCYHVLVSALQSVEREEKNAREDTPFPQEKSKHLSEGISE